LASATETYTIPTAYVAPASSEHGPDELFRIVALRHRHLLRSQAFGMAVRGTDLERLGRYETTLDRKLQRLLGMLLQLQDRRRTINAPAA
jgi:hypothetical protein